MATPYSDVYNSFLDKVTDTDFLVQTTDNKEALLNGYMKRSCTKFKRICTVNLMDRNESLKTFNIDLSEDDIDIISTGMIVEWLKPQYLVNENLKNVLNTKDYNMYSPANLLKELRETYLSSKKEFESMMNKYSYINGNIEELKS